MDEPVKSKTHVDKTFTDLTLTVDGIRFERCKFIECKLIAKLPPYMVDCDVNQSDIVGGGWPEEFFDGVRNVWPHTPPPEKETKNP